MSILGECRNYRNDKNPPTDSQDKQHTVGKQGCEVNNLLSQSRFGIWVDGDGDIDYVADCVHDLPVGFDTLDKIKGVDDYVADDAGMDEDENDLATGLDPLDKTEGNE